MIAGSQRNWAYLPNEAVQFLKAIGRPDIDQVHVRGIHWKKGTTAREGLLTRDPVREWEQQGRGMYLVVNPGGTRDADIGEAVAVFAEWDNRPVEEQLSFDWAAAGLPTPSVIVWSGGGSLHLYWPLSEPCRDVWRWRLLIWRLIRLLGSDEAVENPSRLMRLPGFQYFYSARKAKKLGLEPGSLGGVARLEKCEDRQFSFEDLETAIAAAEEQHGLNPYDAIPSSKRRWPEVVELLERMGLAPTPDPVAAPKPAQKVVELPRRAGNDYPADTLDDIRTALACIPPRIPGSGTYADYRNCLWGLAAALEKAGYDPAMAPALMADHSPAWAEAEDLARIADSTDGSIPAASFWKKAKDHGYRKRGKGRSGGSSRPPREIPHAPLTPPSVVAVAGIPETIYVQDRPVEVELAERVFTRANGFASDGGKLYRYNPERGYWGGLGDVEAKSLVQHFLKRCWQYRTDKETKEQFVVWPYGTDRQVQSAYAVILRNDPQPSLLSAHRRFLVFHDKTLDLQTREVLEHSPEHWAISAVDAPLQLSDECPAVFRQFLEQCYGSGLNEMIRAVVLMCIDPTMPYERAVFLLGGSGTGKGCLIEFIQSLFPAHLRQSLGNPDQLYNADKIHQFVRGRGLLVFPDVTRPVADMSLTYSLIENAPVPTRRLNSSDTEELALGVRLLLASTRPLQLKDGSDGWNRRILTIPTRDKRGGVVDVELKHRLVGTTADHAALRGAVIGWALAMDQKQALTLLRDGQHLIPELAEAKERAEVEADPVANFIDRCLVPAPGEAVNWDQIKRAYFDYCDLENYKRTWSGPQLVGIIRKQLPDSHIRRYRDHSGAMVPARDLGYKLRPGLYTSIGGDSTICRGAMGEGGLRAIRDSLLETLTNEASDETEGQQLTLGTQEQQADRAMAADAAPLRSPSRWDYLNAEQIASAREVIAADPVGEFHVLHDRLTAAGVLVSFEQMPLFVPWIKEVT